MDKQEATNHILARIRAGYGSAEIIDELSRTLKAPPAAVGRFVDQVISEHPEAVAPSDLLIHEGMPGRMEPLPIQVEMPQAAPAPLSLGGDLPPGLQALIAESSTDSGKPSAVQATPAPVQQAMNGSGINLPRQAAIERPADKDEDSNIDLERLAESVFQQLKKQRRHNDVVEEVCNQTGWHWNKSQRFVARVQTKRHDELQSGKNRVIVAIGIGIIFVGLVMALNGASAISDYAKLTAYIRTNPEILLNVSPQRIVYALGTTVTGIGMIIGGGFGIARALSDR